MVPNLMDSLSLGNDLQQNICQQSLVATSVMEFLCLDELKGL